MYHFSLVSWTFGSEVKSHENLLSFCFFRRIHGSIYFLVFALGVFLLL